MCYSYTHMHIYTYTHIHIYTYTHIHMYTHKHSLTPALTIHLHIYTHTHIYIYTHIHFYTYTNIHIYTYTHIHIYTYTHTYNSSFLHSQYISNHRSKALVYLTASTSPLPHPSCMHNSLPPTPTLSAFTTPLSLLFVPFPVPPSPSLFPNPGSLPCGCAQLCALSTVDLKSL